MEFLETRDCLCLASRRAARTITRAYDKALRVHGLRATQFSLLSALSLKGPLSLGSLAALLDIERTTLTRNIAIVENRGLVSSSPGKDPRARMLAVTDKGRDLLTRALADWRAVQHGLTADMGVEAADQLRRIAGPLRLPAEGETP